MSPKSILVLVPTQLELDLLNEFSSPSKRSIRCEAAVCGFGPVASGINAACILAESKSSIQHIALIGIAGSYDLDQCPVGSVISDFSDVMCEGVGAGPYHRIQLPSELGLPICHVGGQPIFESLSISEANRDRPRALLTVCRAADGQADVDRRMTKFPTALAEDMEGFSVALAAHRMAIPVTIIRGISNRAGDRNKANWQIRTAMQVATERLSTIWP